MPRYRLHFRCPEKFADIVCSVLHTSTFRVTRFATPGHIAVDSSNFNDLPDNGKALELGKYLAAAIRGLLRAYKIEPQELWVSGFDSYDLATGQRIQTMVMFPPIPWSIYSPATLEKLSERDEQGNSPASRLICAGSNDGTVGLVLNLFASEPFGWREIYDLIEAIGLEEIYKHYGVPKNKIREIRQTANHFRHLGNQRQYPLPPSPPTEEEARETMLKVAQRYFARHVQNMPSPKSIE